MNELNFHTELTEVFKRAQNPAFSPTSFEMDRDVELETKLSLLGVNFTPVHGKVEIELPSLPVKVFESVDTFLQLQQINSESNIYIFNGGAPLSYISGASYKDMRATVDFFLFSNVVAYNQFLAFLKQQEKEVDESMHFIDSYSRDQRKIVMVSLSDKGRITMLYDLATPHFNTERDYSSGVAKFQECFSEPSKNLIKFLKATIVNFVADKAKAERVKVMFENLEDITAKAKMNFEVYLNNLSIDKIKKDYDDVKSKFFKDLSDILSKLTQQIIVLPIGLCASLLAVDKITDNKFYLYFIGLALCLTSVYLSLLLRVQYKDINHLKRMFSLDYNSLLGNRFFIKYPDEKVEFQGIKTRFDQRVTFLKSISEVYFWILNISNLSIVCFIIYKVSSNLSATLVSALAMSFLLAIARNYVRSQDAET